MAGTNPECSLNKPLKSVNLVKSCGDTGVLYFILWEFNLYCEITLLQRTKQHRMYLYSLLFCIVTSIIMIPFVAKYQIYATFL